MNWKNHLMNWNLFTYDPRGSLFEVLRFEDFNIPEGGYVYTFSINPHYRRGDHYHHKKEEWFTLCLWHGQGIVIHCGWQASPCY